MLASRFRSRSRLRISLLIAIAALVLLAFPAQAAPVDRSTNVLFDFETGDPIEGSRSTLLRTDVGLVMTLQTSNLDPGHAYTIWWVVFNNPDSCEDGIGEAACSEGDLVSPDVNLTLAPAAGTIVGGSGHGSFGGFLRVGDSSDLVGEGTPLMTGPLMNPRGAEVHLVVRGHGPVNPEWMPDQIQTFGGGCDQEHPTYPEFLQGNGVPGDFVCVEPQFTVHTAD